MNCRPGDLAVIVGSFYEANNGKLVKVIRLYTPGEVLPGYRASFVSFGGAPSWVIEATDLRGLDAKFHHGMLFHATRDACLRPIRPQADDATDETLLWKDVPHKETA